MTESNRTHFTLDSNVLRSLVAIAAIAFNTKCSAAIMAGSTGRPGFHLLHPGLVAVGLGLKYPGMTFVAAEPFCVNGMAEWNDADIVRLNGNINRFAMAGHAILFDTESGVTIVAGTTRLPGFHSLHPDLVAVGLGLEDAAMTFFTAKHLRMNGMAKHNGPNRALYSNILLIFEPA